jgi:hypothetical protein
MNAHHNQGVPAHVRRVLWKVVALSLVTVLSFALGGCSVLPVGLAGIGVDASGAPIGYLQVCRKHVDGATLYIDDDHVIGSWQASPTVTDFARWSLTDPGEGWKTETPLGQLQPGVKYEFYGWTSDNTASAAHTSFMAEDLSGLKPGQVRYWSGKENTQGTEDLLMTSSEDEFRSNACAMFSGQ